MAFTCHWERMSAVNVIKWNQILLVSCLLKGLIYLSAVCFSYWILINALIVLSIFIFLQAVHWMYLTLRQGMYFNFKNQQKLRLYHSLTDIHFSHHHNLLRSLVSKCNSHSVSSIIRFEKVQFPLYSIFCTDGYNYIIIITALEKSVEFLQYCLNCLLNIGAVLVEKERFYLLRLVMNIQDCGYLQRMYCRGIKEQEYNEL